MRFVRILFLKQKENLEKIDFIFKNVFLLVVGEKEAASETNIILLLMEKKFCSHKMFQQKKKKRQRMKYFKQFVFCGYFTYAILFSICFSFFSLSPLYSLNFTFSHFVCLSSSFYRFQVLSRFFSCCKIILYNFFIFLIFSTFLAFYYNL